MDALIHPLNGGVGVRVATWQIPLARVDGWNIGTMSVPQEQ